MKLTFVVLAILCLAAQQISGKPADQTYLDKQKQIYELFWHVDQPTVYHPELEPTARSFNISDHINEYNDKYGVTEFINVYERGLLPRGYIFTVTDPEVQHQAVLLFRVLYSAKTFDLFYKTAVWARFYVNEHMFVYTLSVAVIQRDDTRYIRIPPVYEVIPQYFFNDDVIQKTYNIAMGNKNSSGVVLSYPVVSANYSGWFPHKDNTPENKLTYFTEDVGLNAYYFLINHEFPFFLPGNETSFPEGRGEYYFFVHKQLLARYYLERLSNDLGQIPDVTLDQPIQIGYYPSLRYRNGFAFPHRRVGSHLTETGKENLQTIKDLHSRISTAIDTGFVLDQNGERVNIYTKNGLNILGNIVQGNADSINTKLYGHLDRLVRTVLGHGSYPDVKYHYLPSALDIYCTSIRDPMFFSLYKNILSYYHRYKENLPKYTKEDLHFPGVKIHLVQVPNLTTFFEHFESRLDNGVSIRSPSDAETIIAKQRRLTHKEFSYNITVNSEKRTKAIVRVFLGPKYDEFGYEIDLQKHYMNFMLLDKWHVHLPVGTSTVYRDSRDFAFATPDEPSSSVYYNSIKSVLENNGNFDYSEQPYGYPMRLQLPKGKYEGMPYQLLFVLSPVSELNAHQWDSPVRGSQVMDHQPFDFPLDRPIDPLQFFVPNLLVQEVTVHHTDTVHVN